MLKKEGLISKIIGAILLIIIIVVVIILKNKDSFNNEGEPIYGAIGGGKEDLLADEEINKIFAEKYGFKLVQDSWSNGKTVVNDVRREDGSMYDLIFFSDQRFYDEYKTPADPSLGEANRYRVIDGDIILNTPIVMYSWDEVVEALIKDNIVTQTDGIYYITDMEKLMNYILEEKKWSDLGLDIYGKININSVDPVTSSPGATYYGLLLRILTDSSNDEKDIEAALPKLRTFYQKSGYMNNTPADLFSMYLKTGQGSKPIIVDYEKSVIDFANKEPEEWAKIKDKVRILYPKPTIWNSHCIAALSDNGKKLINGLKDKDVSQRAWSRYGFRVGINAGGFNVNKIGDGSEKTRVNGIPSELTSVTDGLNIKYYDRLIEYLKNGE